MVLETMAEAAEELALVEMEFRDRPEAESKKPKSGSSSRKKADESGQKQEGERLKTPVTCFGCEEQGHTLRQCEKDKAEGGNWGEKGNEAAGAGSQGQGAGTTDRRLELMVNYLQRLDRGRALSRAEPFLKLVKLMVDRRLEQPELLPKETLRFQWRPPHAVSW